MKKFFPILISLLLILTTFLPVTAQSNGPVYLPIVMLSKPIGSELSQRPLVNVPYFPSEDVLGTYFGQMAVLWFGQVTSDRSSTDVRLAYTDRNLVVYATVYDRVIAYNPRSSGADITAWDTAALSVQTWNRTSSQPDGNSFRFLSQVRWFEPRNDPRWDAAYRGEAGAWARIPLNFDSNYGYMGTVPGDDREDRGWAITFRIPWSALGYTAKPPEGTSFGLHLETYNRNSQAGPSLASQTWPAGTSATNPSTWGEMRFGYPSLPVPLQRNPVILQVRAGMPGVSVMDADAGGGANCGDRAAPNYFSTWGSLNYAGQANINVQNQGLIADWPCFSKYAIKMSLPALPPGKIIRSARLQLSQMGGSEPSQAIASWIQVFSLGQDWQESTLNWNNFPTARENLGGTWVDVYNPNWSDPAIWTKLPRREWDVTRAVRDAYQNGIPLSLALYSADHGSDGGMHTGKYFVSSDTEDWNANNRPTLIIEAVDP